MRKKSLAADDDAFAGRQCDNNAIYGLEHTARAEGLSPIIAEAICCFTRACRAFPQDSKRWFLEETMVGLLSSASWMSGIASIMQAKAESPRASNPRLDLLVDLPSGSVAFEAKIHYVPFESDAHRITDQLDCAIDEAKNVRHSRAQRYFGISFVLLEQQSKETDLETVLWKTVDAARHHAPSPDIIGWTLLKQREASYRGLVLAAGEALCS